MSIKTKPAAVADGETLNGSLSERNSVGGGTGIHFALDQRDGTTIIDHGSQGLVLTPDNLTRDGAANTNRIRHDQAAPTTGILPASGITADWVAYLAGQIVVAEGEIGLTFGNTAGGGKISFTSALGAVTGSGGTPATTGIDLGAGVVDTVGEDYMLYIAYDSANDVFRGFSSGSGGDFVAGTPKDAATHTDFNFQNLISCYTSGSGYNSYCFGLRFFADGLPSTYLADMADFKDRIITGDKSLPKAWVTLG